MGPTRNFTILSSQMLELGMPRLLPYLLITLLFAIFIGFWHKGALTYRFDQNLVRNYLRSQDIEDPKGLIKDRVILSDSDLYIASGYLYAKGESPAAYDFQVPPFIKYLFGFSILLTGNPFYIQVIFGLSLLFLTYFLGVKLFKSPVVGYLGALGILIDPVFGSMMNEALLDLGQAVFALGYVILAFLFPETFILQGIILGLFAASKFWSTAVIFAVLVFAFKIFLRKEKLDYRKVFLSLAVAVLTYSLVYMGLLIKPGGLATFLLIQGRVLRYMLTHDSAVVPGGPLVLFVSGFFAPWWQTGVIARAADWSFAWPIGFLGSIYLAIKTKVHDIKFFLYLLPIVFLLIISRQQPFTRYFLIILPFVYLNLAGLLVKPKAK